MKLEELRKKAMKKTKEKITKELGRRDKLIVHVVKSIETIDKTSNLLFEQLRDWYSVHFPELWRAIRDVDEYLSIVSELKTRDNFTVEKLKPLTKKAEEVMRKAEASTGTALATRDAEHVSSFASRIRKLREERKELGNYLEELMKTEAPNINAVIGPVIGGKLITATGSLRKLAEMPSSTIQVLGAEKALFAHLKKGVASPKHGIIFQHPWLHSAPKKKRGSIARKIAAKLAIAAKVDYFKGEFIGDKLRRELEEDIRKVLQKQVK